MKTRALLLDDDPWALELLSEELRQAFPRLEVEARLRPDAAGAFELYFIDNRFEGTALGEQLGSAEIEALSFEERLGLLIDREATYRDDRRITSRLRRAKLRHNACLENVDYRHRRGLDRTAGVGQGAGVHGAGSG